MKGLRLNDIYGFQEGYAKVVLNGEWNFIDQKCNLISDQWWDWCWDFNEGCACVRCNGIWNHIDENGNIISEQWWDWCGHFYDGHAWVRVDWKFNHIDTKGNILFPNKWMNSCLPIQECLRTDYRNDQGCETRIW